MSCSALHRHYQKYSKFSDEEKANCSGDQRFGFATIFIPEEEALLSQYLLQASRMCCFEKFRLRNLCLQLSCCKQHDCARQLDRL